MHARGDAGFGEVLCPACQIFMARTFLCGSSQHVVGRASVPNIHEVLIIPPYVRLSHFGLDSREWNSSLFYQSENLICAMLVVLSISFKTGVWLLC